MTIEIKVPQAGESVTKGLLAAWLVEEGEFVEEGDIVFEIETDKASMEVPATGSGTLHRLVDEGVEVNVGQIVGTLTEGGNKKPQISGSEPTTNIIENKLSPAVRRLVDEHNIDPNGINGTGKHGILTKEDILKHLENNEQEQPNKKVERIKKIAESSLSHKSGKGRQTRKVMSLIRKKTAERLVYARQQTAYTTTFNEVDMDKVISIRSHNKEEFEKEHGIRIGFMSFFVKASCQALKSSPVINAYVENNEIIFNHFYDIGIAISLERGLIVPVLRNADKMSFAEIERSIADLALRAKSKKITPDELTGGTFSITNGGVFGSLLSTPIPAFPQSAILGMHTIKKRAVVIDDQIVIRPVMYVALTYDHRIIDGREAIGFLVKVKEFIEEPDKLLLEL